MTIATCYLSPEGIVLGADSTASVMIDPGGFHYFNSSQKLFEIGEDSSLGILTWGLGGLVVSSHRWLIALLADDLKANPPTSVAEVANRWCDQYWTAYTTAAPITSLIQQCKTLNAKSPYDPNAAQPLPSARTKEEEEQFQQLHLGLVSGFCVAGYVLPGREPAAFVMLFDPLAGKPTPQAIGMGNFGFWGAPNMIQRLLNGCDDEVKNAILSSNHWGGTAADLDALLGKHKLLHPILPIRDAIDFVYSCISSTIKALKFSSFSQICGGPIEIAVITTDRKFRWVRHKAWDVAITEGDP